MKSIKYISLFALSFFALSCGEKLDNPKSEAQKEDGGLVEMTFSTTIDNEQTKTVLVDGTDIYFQSTDHISIFDGVQNRDFTACIPGGASQADKTDFIGEAAYSGTYYALYPYTPTATLDGTAIKGVKIPSEQTAVASTFDRAANPSVCVGNKRKLNLKNVGAYLKFTVPSGKTYSKVVVISNDGGAIAGTVNVTVSPTDAPVIDMDQIVNPSSKVTLTGAMEAGSTYYVVVLPTALTGGLTMQFYSDGMLVGNKSSNNELTVIRAKVKNLGTVIPVPPVNPEVVPGQFSINSNGEKIQFAKGNLQYQASTNTWKFADAQYIALGTADYGGNQTETGRDTQAKWIDLFGWGCTGIRHEGMTYNSYQPWTTSTDKLDYYKKEAQELSVENYTDWGCLFSDENNEWFTLSKDEWEYLNNSRPNGDANTYIVQGKRPYYAYVEVNGVPGDLYFADDWTYDKWPSEVTKPTYFNSCGSGSTTYGSYTVEQFALIEATGVVFFPITGYRNGVTVGEGLRRPGGSYGDRLGLYWTRTQKEDTSYAIWAFASGDGRHPNTANGWNNSTAIGTNIPGTTENDAHEGYAVRLVRKVK